MRFFQTIRQLRVQALLGCVRTAAHAFFIYKDCIWNLRFYDFITFLSRQETGVKDGLIRAELTHGLRIWIRKNVFACAFSQLCLFLFNLWHHTLLLDLIRNLDLYLLNVFLILVIGLIYVFDNWIPFMSVRTWASTFRKINVRKAYEVFGQCWENIAVLNWAILTKVKFSHSVVCFRILLRNLKFSFYRRGWRYSFWQLVLGLEQILDKSGWHQILTWPIDYVLIHLR